MDAIEVPPVEVLLDVQREGVQAIQEITATFSDTDWGRPSPCGGWSALDLAGHVLTAIDNWHILLDDSEAGASSPRFTWDEMDAHFQSLLVSLPPGSGPVRIESFAQRAEQYFGRVRSLDPELPLVSALSDVAAVPVNVGLFAWVGGAEWCVHAWDFAQTVGRDYRSSHAPLIHQGMMALRNRTPRTEDPWEAILASFRPATT